MAAPEAVRPGRWPTLSADRASRFVGGRLIPALISFAGTGSKPSNTSRSFSHGGVAAWDNGVGPGQSESENFLLLADRPDREDPAPDTRCPPERRPPRRDGGATPSFHYTCLRRFAPISANRALPGEGTWRGRSTAPPRNPPVLIPSFRHEPVRLSQAVVGVACDNHAVTSKWNYPGTQEPGGVVAALAPGQGRVPGNACARSQWRSSTAASS